MKRIIEELGYDPVDESGPRSNQPGKFYWLMWAKDRSRSKSGGYFETYEEAWQDADKWFKKNPSWYSPQENFPL